MDAPHAALSWMASELFAAAAEPLLAASEVDALIWSADVAFDAPLPAWCDALLDHFAEAGRLSLHGVSFSPFSAAPEPRQERWLAKLAAETGRRRYRRVSDHVGFMTAPRFERGAPLPVPYCDGALEVARANLARLAAAAGGLPVGLENLALAFEDADVDAQGVILRELTGDAPDRFVVLDLHNLHCQAVNFGRDPLSLLAGYPLSRVREIHLSGGRWSYPASDPERRAFRRDTHDGAVPEAVFALLSPVLALCPAVDMVVLEALPVSLRTEAARERFRADFRRLRELLAAPRPAPPALPPPPVTPARIAAGAPTLAAYQSALLARLHERPAPHDAAEPLFADARLAAFADYLRGAEPRALEVAIELAATWGRRDVGGEPG